MEHAPPPPPTETATTMSHNLQVPPAQPGRVKSFANGVIGWVDYFGEMCAGLLGLTDSKYEMEHWEHAQAQEKKARRAEERRKTPQGEEIVQVEQEDVGDEDGKSDEDEDEDDEDEEAGADSVRQQTQREKLSSTTADGAPRKIYYHHWTESDGDSE